MMDLFELFSNNNELVAATQSALLEFLKSRAKPPIFAKDPIIRKNEANHEIHSLCLLRLNQKGFTAPIILGSSFPDFYKVFYENLDATKGFQALTPKLVENDLVKALLSVIEIEFRRKLRKNLDPKPIVASIYSTLGKWTSVTTQDSIQFPFTVCDRDFIFEIPLFTDKFVEERTVALYGFHPNSRILIVDDAPTTRSVLNHHLALAGFTNVEECVNGLDAFETVLMATDHFSLIIADWHMPKLSGLDLLKKIRSTPEEYIKDLPVLLVTGERNKDEVVTALKEGVSGYVVKPFESQTLFDAMKKASKPRVAAKAAP